MVVIPDFPGAMENYGLVTYCGKNLIYDEQQSAAANKQNVMHVNYVGLFILYHLASHKMFEKY